MLGKYCEAVVAWLPTFSTYAMQLWTYKCLDGGIGKERGGKRVGGCSSPCLDAFFVGGGEELRDIDGYCSPSSPFFQFLQLNL